MKKLILTAIALAGFTASVSAQHTIYEWNFSNGDGTAAIDTGNNPLWSTLTNHVITGVDPGVESFSSTGGPYATNGAYLISPPGQGYNSGNTVAAINTSLTQLGTLSQVTVTFWFQLGPNVANGNFPRFVQFGQANNYDAGGKGPTVNGIGSSINGWHADSTVAADQLQDGVGGASSSVNFQFTLTNVFTGGHWTDPTWFITTNKWYFEAITYDATKVSTNFFAYLGTETNSVVEIGGSIENFGPITFSRAATVMMANDNVVGTTRALASGGIADVRILSGIVSPGNLELIRNFATNFPVSGGPPSFITQPQSGSSYVGGNRTLNPGVNGTWPFTYQWQHASTNLLGQTNSTLVLNDLQPNQAGLYNLLVTNGLGNTNSLPATIAVLTPPANSYAAAVMATNPYVYYHLNELDNNVDPLAPVPILDYVRGLDGAANDPANTFFGISDPPYTGFPLYGTAIGIETNGSLSSVTAPSLPGFTNTMAIVGWAYIQAPVTNGGGLFMVRDPNSANGYGNAWGLELVNNSGAAQAPTNIPNLLGIEWGSDLPFAGNTTFLNTETTSNAPGCITTLHVPTGQWVFLAMAGDLSGNMVVYLGDSRTNLQSYTTPGTTLNSYPPNTGAFCIGYDPIGNGGGFPSTVFTPGTFSDVAVFYSPDDLDAVPALSAAEITKLYHAGLGSGHIAALNSARNANNLVLTTWNGTLQVSTNLSTGWTDLSTAGMPTNIPTATAGPQQFFRTRAP